MEEGFLHLGHQKKLHKSRNHIQGIILKRCLKKGDGVQIDRVQEVLGMGTDAGSNVHGQTYST